VLMIDPEDLQAHYDLMLCYNGLGDEKLAREHQARYMRFKADESSQAITGPYRQLHPEDNNERQAVHEHVSVNLAKIAPKHGGRVAPSASSGQALRQAQGKLPPARTGKARTAPVATSVGASR